MIQLEAMALTRKVVITRPAAVFARADLGAALAEPGRGGEEIAGYRAVLQFQPTRPTPRENLEAFLRNNETPSTRDWAEP
jgi:hypothetical protein